MPFLRDEDEEEISAQDAPVLIGEDVPDPSDSEAFMQQPAYEVPEGIDTSPEHYKELLDKSRGSEKTTLSDILALTPRGGRIASFLRGKSAKKMASARAELEYLDKLYERGRQKQKDVFDANADKRAEEEARRNALKYSTEREEIAKGNDPDSSATMLKRELAKQYFPKMSGVIDKMNSNDLDKNLPMLNQQFNSINARLEAKARLGETQASRLQAGDISERNFAAAQDTKAAAKKQTVNEIEERRQNISDALTEARNMIDRDGTFEAFGPHNQNLDRLVDQIATDMAKLQDPNSVARPGEVQLVKNNLIQSGFRNNNETAKKILETFQQEVNRRASTAYKIRGLQEPQRDETGNVIPDTSFGGLASEDVVKMQAPDGTIRYVPKSNVEEAIRAKGRVIQ